MSEKQTLIPLYGSMYRPINPSSGLPLMSKYHLWPQNNLQELNIYLNGFRNIGLKKRIKDMSCVVRVHGIVSKFEQNMQKVEETAEQKTKNMALNLISKINFGKLTDTKENQMGAKLGEKIKQRDKKATAAQGEVGEQGELEFILEDDMQTIKIDKTINLQIEAANVLELAPVMEIFLYKGKGPKRELLSVGNIKLDKALAYYYGLEDNPDYKERFLDFMRLGHTGGGGGEDGEEGHHVRPKKPKVQAQNKMNIFGVKYLVEMPEPKAGLAEKTTGHGIIARRVGNVGLDARGREVQMREEFDMQNDVTENVTIELIGRRARTEQVVVGTGFKEDEGQIREVKEVSPGGMMMDDSEGQQLLVPSYRSGLFSYYYQ